VINIVKKGKRIRANDKLLVFRSFSCMVVFIFTMTVLALNLKSLMQVNWQEISIGNVAGFQITPYVTGSFMVAAVVSGVSVFLYYHYRKYCVKQLYHRQKLAKMILENKWYETEQKQKDSFFKDMQTNRTKERISYFPKMYYRFKENMIYITVEITMGKYQEQFLHLEKKLESGLFCECILKELKESFVEYILIYNILEERTRIQEVAIKDGKIRLMKNLWWDYDNLPHMLVSGGTGSGKTYYILIIIYILLQTDAALYVLDPKNADLSDLGTVMPNVYHTKEDMVSCLERFCEDMLNSSEEMKHHQKYKTGKNYAYLGLPAHFLVFDEYVAFMEMLDHKESAMVLSLLKKIVMLGRQAGYFLILACQRPDAKYLGDGIRDQFNFRVALGRMSELGYGMMFGDSDKEFFLKQIKGRGYLDNGMGVITEFYTPEVSKDFDFLDEIGKLSREKNTEENIDKEK